MYELLRRDVSTQRVVIDRERCNGCWACVRSCPSAALAERAAGRAAEIVWDAGRCLFCRRCEAVCPEHAVGRAPLVGETGGLPEPQVVVRLAAWVCPQCGARFGAGPRRTYTADSASEGGRSLLCPRCRQRETFRAELIGKGEGDAC